MIVLLTLLVTTGTVAGQKVKLTDVKTLTLYEGSYTTGRRSSPVPQLTCVHGGACGQPQLQPKVVQCSNQGSDGFDVQWKCNADLEHSVRFGKTEVTCEGYDYPDDSYVLKGSCGLEYVLEFTNGYHSNRQHSHNDDYSHKKYQSIPSTASNFVTMIGVVILILCVLWMFSSGSNSNEGNRGSHGYGPDGGSGGGGPGWRSPGSGPPPYDDNSYDDEGPSCSRNRSSGPQYGGGGFTSGSAYRRPGAFGNATGGPGFWSGMAAGGLMGYMFGNRGTGSRNYYGHSGYHSQPRYSSGPSWSSGGAGFSGGSAGFSGGTRSASGYGGTRRR